MQNLVTIISKNNFFSYFNHNKKDNKRQKKEYLIKIRITKSIVQEIPLQKAN